MTIEELNDRIDQAIRQEEKQLIPHHNLHSVYICKKNKAMVDFYNLAECIHIDGMSLVLLGRMLGVPLQREHRVTYVDWIHPLMRKISDNGWRVYYLGSKPGVAELAASVLKEEYTDLHIRTHHGYLDKNPQSSDNQSVLKEINEFKPHVLMVGMGMPRQETWVMDNIHHIHANVILTSGACMDYVACVVPTPPRWMGRIGLEWLYRLVSEPKRLASRYLVEPWTILGMLAKEWLTTRRKRGINS